MKKKLLFVLVFVAVFILSCGSSSGSSGARKKKMIIAHGSGETHHLHQSLLKFKEIVESKGNFEVEI